MIYNYKGTNIHYELLGNGKTHIVFLHGWGGSIDCFKFTKNYLNQDCSCLFIDFPPFGHSQEPMHVFTMLDYVDFTEQIINICKLKNVILVGHSFGGRVAVILANRQNVKKLFLIDSAGLKPKSTIKYFFKKNLYKLAKKLNIKYNIGSKDYKNLSINMKKIFVNIVNTYLEEYAININIPCIIFWGKKDKETPLYMAKRYNKLIKNSQLIVYKDSGHFSYLDKINEYIAVLNYFIEN